MDTTNIINERIIETDYLTVKVSGGNDIVRVSITKKEVPNLVLRVKKRRVPANNFDVEVTCGKYKSVEEAQSKFNIMATVHNVKYRSAMENDVQVTLTENIENISRLKVGNKIIAYTESGVYKGELIRVISQSVVIVGQNGKGNILSDHLVAGSKIVFFTLM